MTITNHPFEWPTPIGAGEAAAEVVHAADEPEKGDS